MTVLGIIIVGLIAGYIARLAVPGRDPMGLVGTLLLGIVGSFIGGFLWNLFAGGGDILAPSGLIGSIVGAIIALLIYRAMRTRRRV